MKEKSKLGLAGIKTPVTYWRGYDPKDDEALARKLFLGQAVQAKNGRRRHEYLSGQHERDAISALYRLLSLTRRPLDLELLALLTGSLNPEGGSERHLVFQFRKKKGKRKKRHDLTADLQVAWHVAELMKRQSVESAVKKRAFVESAVKEASTKFGITTKTVYAIIKRTKDALKLTHL